MVNAEADEFLRCSAFGGPLDQPRGVFQGGKLKAGLIGVTDTLDPRSKWLGGYG